MFEDLVQGDHFHSTSGPLHGCGMRYADRVMRLWDERFHIGQFVLELPDRVAWTPEVFDIFGLQHREGHLSLADLVGAFEPEDRQRLVVLIAGSLRDRKGFHATLRVRQPGGEVRLAELACDVITNDGRLGAMVGLVRDVTRTVAQAPPQGEAERMGAIVAVMPVPAVLTDTSMRIVACSDVWARSHGVLGRNVRGLELIAAVDKAPVGWALEHDKVLGGKTITTERTYHSPASGRPLVCPTTLVPWVDSQGTVCGVLTMIGWSEFAFASKEIAILARKQMRGGARG